MGKIANTFTSASNLRKEVENVADADADEARYLCAISTGLITSLTELKNHYQVQHADDNSPEDVIASDIMVRWQFKRCETPTKSGPIVTILLLSHVATVRYVDGLGDNRYGESMVKRHQVGQLPRTLHSRRVLAGDDPEAKGKLKTRMIMCIGQAGTGVGTRFGGHLRFGGEQMRKRHRRYQTVGISTETWLTMTNLMVPTVKSRPNGELGIYKVRVTTNSSNQAGFFPIRYQDVTYSSKASQTYDAWYTSVDIDIAIEEGHEIKYITFEDVCIGYSWKHKGHVFKDYIQDVLYKLKLMYEQKKDEEKREVIKLIMNSLWGKFAQKWMDTQYKIINEEDVQDDFEAYKIWDTHHILVKSTRNKYIADKPVQNGVFVLSWARHHMKLWKECVKPNTICLYSDTDSLFVPYVAINHDSPLIGNEMGQLDLEYVFETFICVGKKQYIGSYYDNGVTKYKKRFKGVPQVYIGPDLFMHLLHHPDNKTQINFLKFKREWGVIRGYIESKTVKQT